MIRGVAGNETLQELVYNQMVKNQIDFADDKFSNGALYTLLGTLFTLLLKQNQIFPFAEHYVGWTEDSSGGGFAILSQTHDFGKQTPRIDLMIVNPENHAPKFECSRINDLFAYKTFFRKLAHPGIAYNVEISGISVDKLGNITIESNCEKTGMYMNPKSKSSSKEITVIKLENIVSIADIIINRTLDATSIGLKNSFDKILQLFKHVSTKTKPMIENKFTDFRIMMQNPA